MAETWQDRTKPLRDRMSELGAFVTWEGYISLNTEKPKSKDLLVQHWCVPHDDGPPSYYISRIFVSGQFAGGWQVYKAVDDTNDARATLEAIV